MIGADVVRLKELAGQFDIAASQLNDAFELAFKAVELQYWSGPDADRFRDLWRGPVRKRVEEAGALLTGAAQHLHRQVEEQIDASDAAGAMLPPPCLASDGFHQVDLMGNPLDAYEQRAAIIEKINELDDLKDLERLRQLLENGQNLSHLQYLLRNNLVPEEKLNYLGVLLGGADVWNNVDEHGWGSPEAVESMARAIGNFVVGKKAPVIGPVLFDPMYDAFLKANDLAKELGDAGGGLYVRIQDVLWNSVYGSDEGWSATQWLLQEYGATDFDNLDEASRVEARARYMEFVDGGGGFNRTIVGTWYQGIAGWFR